MRTLVSLGVVLAATLSAQKIPDPKNPQLEIQLHDVADFVVREGDPIVDVEDAFRPQPSLLAETARSFIHPPLALGEDIAALGETYLAARLRPEQHAWLRTWLKDLREVPARQFDVTARFLELSSADFARHVAPLLTDKSATLRRVESDTDAWTVDPKAMDKALAAANSMRRVEAPRLLAYQMSRASMSLVRNQTYVRTYTSHPKNKEWVPVVDVCRDGQILDVQATLLPGGSHGLLLRPSLLALLEMKNDNEKRAGKALPIQVPTLLEWKAELHAGVPQGKVVVLSKAPPAKGQPHRLIVVRSKVVE